jgi:hypothetical protein
MPFDFCVKRAAAFGSDLRPLWQFMTNPLAAKLQRGKPLGWQFDAAFWQ